MVKKKLKVIPLPTKKKPPPKPPSLLTSANVNMEGKRIVNMAPGIAPTDAATVSQLSGGGGGGAPTVEYRVISSPEAAAKQLTLLATPATGAFTLLDVIGGGAQRYSTDFSVSGAILNWNTPNLGTLLSAGDVLRIVYWP